MMPTTTETTILRGGEWLLQSSEAGSVFTPERLTEEHRLIAQTVSLGLRADSLPPLVEALCAGLTEAGMALLRLQLAMPARHALFDAEAATWRRGSGVELRSFAHGGRDQEPFRSSAFAHMLATGTLTLRYRMPLPLGPVRVEGRIAREEGRKVFVEASITGSSGVALEADGVFITPTWSPVLTPTQD